MKKIFIATFLVSLSTNFVIGYVQILPPSQSFGERLGSALGQGISQGLQAQAQMNARAQAAAEDAALQMIVMELAHQQNLREMEAQQRHHEANLRAFAEANAELERQKVAQQAELERQQREVEEQNTAARLMYLKILLLSALAFIGLIVLFCRHHGWL